MTNSLFYNAINPLLFDVLQIMMATKEFESFRLIGDTALCLYKGHRKATDIDVFTDAPHGSVDFDAIDIFLKDHYPYVTVNSYDVGVGKSYFVGENDAECIKLDVFYTDEFVNSAVDIDGIRLASVEDIIAMKLDTISRGGGKKDFWDIHELMNIFSIDSMFSLHKKRYPDSHDRVGLKTSFSQFGNADTDVDPVCLRAKNWELIKANMIDFVNKLS